MTPTQQMAEALATKCLENVVTRESHTYSWLSDSVIQSCCLNELLAVATAATKHERCIIEGSTVIPPHVKTYNDTSVKLREALNSLRAKLKERGIEL